jgi:hypothetical protein
MSFGRLGALGRGFGKLGAPSGGSSEPPEPPPEGAPEMQFDNELNSQLLAVLEDF